MSLTENQSIRIKSPSVKQVGFLGEKHLMKVKHTYFVHLNALI